MEASINMRVFKTILLVLALMAVGVRANPLLHYTRERDARPERNEMPGPEAKKEQIITDHYDQRQNGTENYRVKVDGLVFILAPADTLLLGAALEPNFTSLFSDANKPKPKPEKDELLKPKPEKEDIPKSIQHETLQAGHKPALRISNLIAPFLNRIRHSQQSRK